MPFKPEEDDLGPSKSELKREMTERQKLAEVLSKLSSDALKSVPLEENIRDAIAQTQKIKTFEALRRHKQYLGKLMRALDAEEIAAIEKRLEIIEPTEQPPNVTAKGRMLSLHICQLAGSFSLCSVA